MPLLLPARAELVEFYIGIDSRPTLTSGPYIGQVNPNAGRLTFFYGHAYGYVPGFQPHGQSAFDNNHYHGISSYSYTGPADNPITLNTNSNSRIPESSTAQPPITLILATDGIHAGKLVSARTAEHYSDRRIQSVWWLNDPARYGPGSPEWAMFYSSGGTRTNTLAGAQVALELVEKSGGLHVGSADQLDILSDPGDRHPLGDGNLIDFTPVFWAEGNAPAGHYWASFKLVDISTEGDRTPTPESGLFWLDFQVAPEPALAIAPAVNLTLPLVTPGYVLEGAASLDGPWTPVTLPHGVHSGNQQTVTFPAAGAIQLFRLRKE